MVQEEWEKVRSEESRRQRLERKALDQQSRTLAKLPTRKERGEVRACSSPPCQVVPLQCVKGQANSRMTRPSTVQ